MPATARRNGTPYGHAHRKTREALIARALGTPCPLRRSRKCVGIMTDPRLMHLDHSRPVALGGTEGDRIVCAHCNTSAGATLGNKIRGARRRTTRKQTWHSRSW